MFCGKSLFSSSALCFFVFHIIKRMTLNPVKSMAADYAKTGAVLTWTTDFLSLMLVPAIKYHPRGFGEPKSPKQKQRERLVQITLVNKQLIIILICIILSFLAVLSLWKPSGITQKNVSSCISSETNWCPCSNEHNISLMAEPLKAWFGQLTLLLSIFFLTFPKQDHSHSFSDLDWVLKTAPANDKVTCQSRKKQTVITTKIKS